MLTLIAAAPAVGQSITYRVGGDAGCDFATIQPAIDAAAVHGGADRIHVATNATYTAQALNVGGQDLVIAGGFTTCTQPLPTSVTIISGFDGAADSVIDVTGNGTRSLIGLQIRDGDETNGGVGGGIDFEGQGTLTLSNVTVAQNRAGYGGGISVEGTSALTPATLVLANDVVVQNNTANGSGGGIRMSGASHLEMVGSRIALLSNKALGNDADSGYGGGLQVLASATAHIRSSYLNFGAIAFNEAKYGGGLAVLTRFEDGFSDIALATPDQQTPIRLHDNLASVAGGAIYVDVPDEVDQRRIRVCMAGYRLDHNQAPAGAAIYVNGPNFLNAQFFVNAGICDGAAPTLPRCAAGNTGCNRIDHNLVAQANGQPAAGAVVEVTRGRFEADGVAWTDNVGADILHALDNGQTTFGNAIRNCVIANNQLTGQTLAISDDATVIRNCTIAGNTLGLSTVMTITGALDLQDSIIWQPGKFSLGSAHGTLAGGHVVTNDVASLAPLIRLVNRDPRFVDPALGDYRLRAASPAVDFAAATPSLDVDVDGIDRDRDLLVVDQFGPRDLGGHERAFLIPILLNGGFTSDLRHWNAVVPNVSSFDPNGGQTGAGDGGLSFDWEDPNSQSAFVRITSSAQCVHLPLPGTYRLRGSARTSGSLPPITVQTAKLHWALRRDGGEACTQGPVSIPEAEGDLSITSGSGWATASTANEIRIDPSVWTINSSLTVSTVMQSSAITATPRTRMQGWFDAISLELETELLLADGFESP